MLQKATPSGNQRPDLLTSLMNMSLVLRLPFKKLHVCHWLWTRYKASTFCSILARCRIPCACHAKRHLNVQKWSGRGMFCTFWLRHVLRATTACTFSASEPPKVVRAWCVVHFDLEMCFAPQRRAIFHLSSGQMAPHPPLWRAYFSTRRSHKSLEKHSGSRRFYLFAHLHLLSSDCFSPLIFFLLLCSSLTLPTCALHLSILSEVWLQNFLR